MEQKRKVKSLVSITEAPELGFLSKFLIALSFLFCFGALSLTIFSISFVSANDASYKGLEEKTEVLYKLDFVRREDLQNVISTIRVDDKGGIDRLYITPTPVVIKRGTSSQSIGKYAGSKYVNLLGGNNLTINSDNISIIGGNELTVNEKNDNATILGGNGNKINSASTLVPNVIIGGNGNTVEGSNAVILGGNSNTIKGKNSFILGGENNKVNGNGNNVIVAGKNITADQENIFVFSNDNESFTPQKGNAFYINVQKGLGINMNSTKGVTVSGAVKFGSLGNSCIGSDDYGLIGLDGGGVLQGCSSIGEKKIGTFDADEGVSADVLTGYCTGADYLKMNESGRDRYEQCQSLDGYKNVVFETKFLTGDVTCPSISNGKNPCVYVCAERYHYDESSGICKQDCEIPWSGGNYKKHGELITGYTESAVVCAEGSTCESKKAVLKCNDGEWEKISGKGPDVSYNEGEINYKYEFCANQENKSCDEEFKFIKNTRDITNWVRGESCVEYDAGTCKNHIYYKGSCYPNYDLKGGDCKREGGNGQCICEPQTRWTGNCINLPQNAVKLITGFKQTATGDKGEWYPESKNYVYYKDDSSKNECTYKCDTGYLYSTGNDELKLSTGCWTGCKVNIKHGSQPVYYNHGTVTGGYIYDTKLNCENVEEYICINGKWMNKSGYIAGNTETPRDELYKYCQEFGILK